MGPVARWSVSTGRKRPLMSWSHLMELMWKGRRHSRLDPHKMDSLESHFSQSNVPPSLKGIISRLVPYGVLHTFDLFPRSYKQGTKFKKEKPNERDTQKHTLFFPKHTPTQRLHFSMTTLNVVTSWWGAFVMLSKIENMFWKTITAHCRNWVMCPEFTINLGKYHSPNGQEIPH